MVPLIVHPCQWHDRSHTGTRLKATTSMLPHVITTTLLLALSQFSYDAEGALIYVLTGFSLWRALRGFLCGFLWHECLLNSPVAPRE
jgi:hypothetical protein